MMNCKFKGESLFFVGFVPGSKTTRTTVVAEEFQVPEDAGSILNTVNN